VIEYFATDGGENEKIVIEFLFFLLGLFTERAGDVRFDLFLPPVSDFNIELNGSINIMSDTAGVKIIVVRIRGRAELFVIACFEPGNSCAFSQTSFVCATLFRLHCVVLSVIICLLDGKRK